MRRPGRGVAAVIPLVLACAGMASRLDTADYMSHVKYLASDELQGRGNGSPGLEKAAEYLERQFRIYGIPPVPGHGYFQDFPIATGAKLGAKNDFEYELAPGKSWEAGVLYSEFVPLNLSASGETEAPVVFAGYGITAPEYGYDDYAGLDVRGKVVLVLRHEPRESDANSKFEGKDLTVHAQFFSKASNAKMHGAAAVLLVNDVGAHPGTADKLEPFGEAEGPEDAGIEFAQVSAAVADAMLEGAHSTVRQAEEAIDANEQPHSFALPEGVRVRLRVDLDREVKTVHNVVAYLPGEESGEYVIVGAHYDHLGLGGRFSLAPSQTGTIHPGADDNASGAAGVLEIARLMKDARPKRRGVLFVEFAGEELGLLGSSYYVNHPRLPLKDAVAMINMDMIGRIRDHKVYVGGSGTGTTFGALLDSETGADGITAELTERAGYGASDHTSFTAKQIPTLFFFSGLHADYHRPSDTWDKINGPETIHLLAYISDVVDKLAASEERPKFVAVAEPQNPHSGTGGGAGYGPYFGSVPDFTELPNGVRLADITPGSPAAKAGFKAGDILTEFDGKPIQNLYDFTYALRARKPGDEVVVKVLRGGQTVVARVMLTQRR
jgi:Zn-dependent M28 family amino/carboxypeptidase